MSSKVNLTPQRKAILETIKNSKDHPTAADVIDRLAKDGQHFAYGTVYNSLKYLTEAGVIRELKLGDAASRYDGNMDEHHHIQCRVCGKVDEIDSALPLEWLQNVERETDYTLELHQVIFKGVCKACRESVTS